MLTELLPCKRQYMSISSVCLALLLCNETRRRWTPACNVIPPAIDADWPPDHIFITLADDQHTQSSTPGCVIRARSFFSYAAAVGSSATRPAPIIYRKLPKKRKWFGIYFQVKDLVSYLKNPMILNMATSWLPLSLWMQTECLLAISALLL